MRDYEGNGLVVHWDAERCQHSGRCIAGAPTVFDSARRPWIIATALDADALAAVVDTCPSGALSYTRTDGGPHGRRGFAAGEDSTAARRPDDDAPDVPSPTPAEPGGQAGDAACVTPRLNGPLVVDGPIALVGPDGTTEVHERLFLCRCGQSMNKPNCDGSHKRVGFEADGVAPPARP